MRMLKCAGLAAAMLVAAGQASEAQQLGERVEVHGFGSWAYGATDGYGYRSATKEGEYGNSSLALNVSGAMTEQLRVNGQINWDAHNGEAESEIDYIFGEYAFKPALKLRVGQVKQPFGNYTELYHVGTVRPFLMLPQSMYGAAGFVAESYRGVGLTGRTHEGGSWGVAYDAYVGGMSVHEEEGPMEYLFGEVDSTTVDELESEHGGMRLMTNVFGGRLTVEPPVSGLSVGVSAYSGSGRHGEEGEGESEPVTVAGVHGEYAGARLSARAELARQMEEQFATTAAYAEVAFHVTQRWQLAGLVDNQRTTVEGDVDVSAAPSLLEHTELGLGLNYWFGPQFVVKASVHAVDGNRFARPNLADLSTAIATGSLDRSTQIVRFGGQFSF